MTADGQVAVKFGGVTKAYGDVVAVDQVSFEIQKGDLVTLLGPSGCGKTTTLRLIAGLEMATSGTIAIGDRDVTVAPATERDVSMVFQSYALFPHMSVSENVSYGLRVSGVAKAKAIARGNEALDLVGLADLGSRMPSELSGGQQQRVAVARALVLEPQVLLFDEPLSNLDAKLRRRVREEIREIQQSLNLTTVYVTHDQEEALAVSDRIIVMKNAIIAQDGTPRQLYENPIDSFVADFIGDANIVQGEVVATNGDVADVKIGEVSLILPSGGAAVGPVQVAIRPEAIRIGISGQQAPISGTVQKATYLGSHMEYTLETAIGTLFAVDPQIDAPVAAGTEVKIALAERGVTFISG